ncbi:DUF692 domain-containing protein [Ramlibacter sp.]|uniref:DUF692 domain-containing protein n=1 Tax=Ramlibacter sp. TaxID=1917967 RepID=UPI0017FCA0F4|nr:DUF692 domain-containing protein [Ramlibacter sp.]MBA2676228.1 DUF692 domain-containing protein [Ramlibacter sp.]
MDGATPGAAPRPVGIGWRHPHYAELLAARPALDFLEVHSENFFGAGGAALAVLEQARRAYPVSLHGVGLALGSAAGIDAWHLEQLARLVQRIDPLLVSDHACFARAPWNGGIVHAADLLPIPFNTEALDVLAANVQRVQDRLRRPLLLENLSAYVTLAGSDRGEPEFLAALARRTGCKLLVDVNNIYVNALNARRAGDAAEPLDACRRWLDALPPPAVGELHVAGHCVLPDIVIDDHGSGVCDAVWSLHAHAIGRFGAVPTLVEWDTGIPALGVLLAEAEHARSAAQHTGAPA